MSVIVILKVPADTTVFRQALIDRSAEFVRSRERAIASGALHHRFAVGPAHVIAIDEWERAEQFEQFFSEAALHDFVESIGCDVSKPPEVWVGEAIDSPDYF